MRNVMLQNSISLMVQPEFSPVNCPLSANQLWIENSKMTGLKKVAKNTKKNKFFTFLS